MNRNTFPTDQYDLLQRALQCNKTQLAEHLKVTPKTLRGWREEGKGGANAAARVAQLWATILKESDTQWLEVAPSINFGAIRTIGGRR